MATILVAGLTLNDIASLVAAFAGIVAAAAACAGLYFQIKAFRRKLPAFEPYFQMIYGHDWIMHVAIRNPESVALEIVDFEWHGKGGVILTDGSIVQTAPINFTVMPGDAVERDASKPAHPDLFDLTDFNLKLEYQGESAITFRWRWWDQGRVRRSPRIEICKPS
jgi:hypothetical protein